MAAVLLSGIDHSFPTIGIFIVKVSPVTLTVTGLPILMTPGGLVTSTLIITTVGALFCTLSKKSGAPSSPTAASLAPSLAA